MIVYIYILTQINLIIKDSKTSNDFAGEHNGISEPGNPCEFHFSILIFIFL